MSSGNPNPPRDDKRNYIGIEFEYFMPISTYGIFYQGMIAAGFTVQAENLGTRPEGMGLSLESTMLAVEDDYQTKFRDMLNRIQAAGGQVNSHCGLHVHLDLRHRHADRFPDWQNDYKGCPAHTRADGTKGRWNMVCDRFAQYADELRGLALAPRIAMGGALGDRGKRTIEVRYMNAHFDADYTIKYIERLKQIINEPFPAPVTAVKKPAEVACAV